MSVAALFGCLCSSSKRPWLRSCTIRCIKMRTIVRSYIQFDSPSCDVQILCRAVPSRSVRGTIHASIEWVRA